VNWTQRILDFPVRTAAVDDFLRDLRAKGSADLNAVLTTLNEGGLCRKAVDHWVHKGWIVLAPDSPLIALAGSRFRRELTLHDFCGAISEAAPEDAVAEGEEETQDDDDS
jgi:hypothetical protein